MIARVVAATLAAVGSALAASAPDSPPNPVPAAHPAPAVRIVVDHDIDCLAAAFEIEQAIDDAIALRASTVILDLGGNTARLDLVSRLGPRLRDAGLPTVAWIDGGDDLKVGPGQLALALFADRLVVRDRVTVGGAIRGSHDDLADKETPWEILAGELRDRLAARLALREQPEALADPLVGRRADVYVSIESTPARFIAADSPLAGARQVARTSNGLAAVSLTTRDLRDTRLAEAAPRDWAAAAEHLGLPRRIETRAVAASAARARLEAADMIVEIESRLESAKRALDLPSPARRSVAPRRYRDAAQSARAHLDHADARLADLEALLTRIPEVLRLPAPGQGPLERPSGYATKWRSTVRGLRGDFADHDRKAREFAAQ